MKENKEILKTITQKETSLTNEEHFKIFAQKLFDKTMEKIKKDLSKMSDKDRASIVSVNIFKK